MDTSYWNGFCYWRCNWEPLMAVVKASTPRPELPPVVKIKNKIFKVGK
jgi:hypothetical protein